eukprot:TRINITY_DN29622_c0_g1_i1.p1 TRINITY_DN29622_c0_g1~~TRINITY_DN29622_c0_g1_i1.p1  ORF type:complete len:836 (-),score=166.79 TRINITY_DN29622_c0_g1_i1:334-2502(-)
MLVGEEFEKPLEATLPTEMQHEQEVAEHRSIVTEIEVLDHDQQLAEILTPPDKEETLARLNSVEISEREIRRMKDVFRFFVEVGSDEIHEDSLEAILEHLGYLRLSKEDVRDMVAATTQYSTLDVDEFLSFMHLAKKREQAHVRNSFDSFDEDKSGELSANELADLLKSLGITPFRSTIADALSVVDEDGSGTLNFCEFAQLLMIYRKTEGFSKEELKKLHRIFERFSTLQGDPPRQVLIVGQMKEALMYMFGTHCSSLASELTQGIVDQGGMNFRQFVVWARKLREAEVQAYRQEFIHADEDGGGTLEFQEIKGMLERLGYTPLKTLIVDVLRTSDTDGGGTLDFDEFVNMMQLFRVTDGFTQHELDRYTQLFNEFDRDHAGTIDVVQASAILRHLGISTDIKRAEAMLQTVDRDGSNSLDFQEFLRLLRLHREDALSRMKKVFAAQVAEAGVMAKIDVLEALAELGYTEAIAKQSFNVYFEMQGNELDFDGFVAIVDLCRQFTAEKIRKQAGYSDTEIGRFATFFASLDADGSGALEREELVEFCKDQGLPLRTKSDRNELFRMVEEARANALQAGVSSNECDKIGSPVVPYWVFIHLMRVLQTAKDIEFAEQAHGVSYELGKDEVDQLKRAFARKWKERGVPGISEDAWKIDVYSVFDLVEELGIELNALLRDQVKLKLFMEFGEGGEDKEVSFEVLKSLVTWLGNTTLSSSGKSSCHC